MEAAIIIGLIVWFIASIPETNRRYAAQQLREEMDARRDKEDAELIAFLRENGDPLNLLPSLEDRP